MKFKFKSIKPFPQTNPIIQFGPTTQPHSNHQSLIVESPLSLSSLLPRCRQKKEEKSGSLTSLLRRDICSFSGKKPIEIFISVPSFGKVCSCSFLYVVLLLPSLLFNVLLLSYFFFFLLFNVFLDRVICSL